MVKRSRGPASRRSVRLPVEFRFEQSELRLFGTSRNMSQTGMLVLSEDPKQPGTPVRFKFEEFRGKATVVWRREEYEGTLLGMHFTALQGPDRHALVRILRESAAYS